MQYPSAASQYEDFLRAVFPPPNGETGAGALREDAGPRAAEPVPELEVQARWFAGEFGRDFVGRDGEAVEIVQFGHWNRSAGPDFTEAVVKINGVVRRGAIEVDITATDWEAHGHGANPDYDEVVLHVHCDGRQAAAPRFFTRTSRHQAVAQLPIDLAASDEPAGHWGHLPVARRGRCATPLREMGEAALESLMTAAAQYRLRRKARRHEVLAATHSDGQALLQGTAEALGYRHNKLTMAVLAQRLSLATLKRQAAPEREALLFGVAGFLDPERFENTADPEARHYLKSLWDHWWKHRAQHEPEAPHRRLPWRMAGTRPVNHPQRRVAALAALVNDWPAYARLVGARPTESPEGWTRDLTAYLGQLKHAYWSRHYTLKANPAPKPLALIGKDRIQDLLGNVLFPAAISSRPNLWAAYRLLPGSDMNESLKRAALRLFGPDSARIAAATRRYWQQQALLQIYRDFCLRDGSDCADCPFPEQLAQWREG